MNIVTIDEQIEYFNDNIRYLVSNYNHKYIVVKDKTVVGCYDSLTEGYFDAVEKYGLGTFLLRYVTNEKDFYTVTLSPRLIVPCSSNPSPLRNNMIPPS